MLANQTIWPYDVLRQQHMSCFAGCCSSRHRHCRYRRRGVGLDYDYGIRNDDDYHDHYGSDFDFCYDCCCSCCCLDDFVLLLVLEYGYLDVTISAVSLPMSLYGPS